LDIYLKRRRWKLVLLIVAIVIGVASLLYTNWLTDKMAHEERNKVELWAEATKRLSDAPVKTNSSEMEDLNTKYLNFLSKVTTQNTTIPIIIVDKDGSFNLDANIHYKKDRREQVLKKELKKMKAYSAPIPIELSEESRDSIRKAEFFKNIGNGYLPVGFFNLLFAAVLILMGWYFAPMPV